MGRQRTLRGETGALATVDCVDARRDCDGNAFTRAVLAADAPTTPTFCSTPLSTTHAHLTTHPISQVRPTDIDEFNVVRNTVFHEYILGSAFF